MKKQALLFLANVLMLLNPAMSQVVSDTVTLGSGYANQVWYQLDGGTKTSVAKNTWDIAFATGGMSSTIWINPGAGVQLWAYPDGAAADWANLNDTTGISSWKELSNSNLSWGLGAFSTTADPNDDFDLGWADYLFSQGHRVVGDSLYVIKTAANDYKKLYISTLKSGKYHFQFANVDGSGEVHDSISKDDFVGKNFGYYSLDNQLESDPEPLTNQWDLYFGEYTDYVSVPYPVAGVLHNVGAEVAEATPIAGPDTATNYNDFTFSPDINTIGYNWKDSRAGTISDSLAYFVKTAVDSTVWRVQFTGFESGLSGDGKIIFNKENLGTFKAPEEPNDTTSIFDIDVNAPQVKTYPNPASGSNITVLLNDSEFAGNADLSIYSLTGALLKNEQIFVSGNFQQHTINISDLNSGAYVLQLRNEKFRTQHKLIVQ